MYKIIILALVAMLCLCACTAKTPAAIVAEAATEGAQESTIVKTSVGGWKIYSDDTTAPLPKQAKDAFDRAMEGLVGVKYTPIALIGTQVVAGTNYAILCRAVPVVANPETRLAVVIVYESAEGKAEIKNIADFNLSETMEAKDKPETAAVLGGWTIPEDYSVINLPAEAATAFTKAMEGFTGSNLEPLAYLGSQLVSGTNYAILCRATTESTAKIVVATVYADLNGGATVTGIFEVRAADYNV